MRWNLPALIFLPMLLLLFSSQSAAQVDLPDYVIDCSGCSPSEKQAAAAMKPDSSLLYGYPAYTMGTSYVDVTDYYDHVIVRYRVNLMVSNFGPPTRYATSIAVPSSTLQKFADSDSLVDTVFLGPGEDFLGVDPVPVDYPSAFDLLGDNGYQANILSNAVNDEIGGLLQQAWTMLNDFLNQQDRVVVTEAQDGTIILVKAQLLSNDGIWWVILPDGLRLADGNIIQEDWLDDQPIGFSGSGIAIDQLYNGMTGLGYDIDIFYGGGGGQCEYEFSCDENQECTLVAKGAC